MCTGVWLRSLMTQYPRRIDVKIIYDCMLNVLTNLVSCEGTRHMFSRTTRFRSECEPYKTEKLK